MQIIFQLASLLVLLATSSKASPISPRQSDGSSTHASETEAASQDWGASWVQQFPIHPSCNSTQRIQLEKGLGDAVKIALHARDHLLRWGNSSELKTKYFGNASTAEPIGWYERIAYADKSEMLFRCDDPDRNCETQKGMWLYRI